MRFSRAVPDAAPGAPAAPEEFHAAVWALVRRIPPGRVMTYGQVAEEIAFPRRARAVGFAMRHSPPDVPWHRVVSARGVVSPRPDREGMREQCRRLELEGVRFDAEGRFSLSDYLWHPDER